MPNPPEHVVMPMTRMATSALCTAFTAAAMPERSVLLMSTPFWNVSEMAADASRAELAAVTASRMAARGVMSTQPASMGGF